jgi:hypothetical protein
MHLPRNPDRVPQHTAESVNHALRMSTKEDLEYYRAHPREIDGRLWKLEKEWDVERVFEAGAATLILTGVVLAKFVSRRFLFVPGIAAALLLQHALHGWSPPLPIVRRLGFRTQREIEGERRGLRTMRKRVLDERPDYVESLD